MSTAEYLEECLGIKLFDIQKRYLDFLDNNPEAEIIIPRGRCRMMDLTTLYGVVRVAIEEIRKEEDNDR